MAIGPTPVQTAKTYSGASTTGTATFGAGVTNGNLLVARVMVGAGTGLTFTTPTNWFAGPQAITGTSGGISTAIFYTVVNSANGFAGSTAFAFAWSTSHSFGIYLEEWNSTTGWPASPLDQQNTLLNTAATTSLDTGAVTPTSATSLWIAAIAYKAGSQTINSLTAGWTFSNDANGTSNSQVSLYQVAAAIATAEATGTLATTAEINAGAIATFTPVAPAAAMAPQVAHGQYPNSPNREATLQAITNRTHGSVNEQDSVWAVQEWFYSAGAPDPLGQILDTYGMWTNSPLRITQRGAMLWRPHNAGTGVAENDLSSVPAGIIAQFFGLVDAFSVQLITEGAIGSEVVSLATVAVPLTDSAAGSDSVSLATITPSVADSATGSEVVTLATITPSVTDSATGSDVLIFGFFVTDSAAGSDSVSILILVPLTDSAAGSDSVSLATITPSLTDSAAGSESLSFATNAFTVADSAAGTESVSVAIAPQVSDSATGSDSVSLGTITPSITDTATGSQSLSLFVAFTVSDNAAGSDAISIVAVLPTLTDSAAGSDSVSLFITFSVSDSAAGSEVVTLPTITPSVSDSAAGADAVSLFTSFTITDSAIGNQTVNLAPVIVALVDSAAGSDTLALLVMVAIPDSAAGSDAVSLRITWLPPALPGGPSAIAAYPNGSSVLIPSPSGSSAF